MVATIATRKAVIVETLISGSLLMQHVIDGANCIDYQPEHSTLVGNQSRHLFS
jgi:hypothetical protein